MESKLTVKEVRNAAGGTEWLVLDGDCIEFQTGSRELAEQVARETGVWL